MNDRMHAIYRAFGQAVEQAGQFHQKPEAQPMTTGPDIIAAIKMLACHNLDVMDHVEYVRLSRMDEHIAMRERYERALQLIAGDQAGDPVGIAVRALRPEEGQ